MNNTDKYTNAQGRYGSGHGVRILILVRDKLKKMTQQEWENATEQEREEEFERCKKPVYFYNTYWLNNGVKPTPITQEQYDYYFNSDRPFKKHRRRW